MDLLERSLRSQGYVQLSGCYWKFRRLLASQKLSCLWDTRNPPRMDKKQSISNYNKTTPLVALKQKFNPWSIHNLLNSVDEKNHQLSLTFPGVSDQGFWSSGGCCPVCDLLGAVPQTKRRSFKSYIWAQMLQFSSEFGRRYLPPNATPPPRKIKPD